MTDANTVLDTLIDENARRLTLIKKRVRHRATFSYIFRAELAPDADGDEWASRDFDSEEQARTWLKTTEQKRARAKRVRYEFPVTVRHTPRFSETRFEPGILKGVNATDGYWRVQIGQAAQTKEPDSIFHRMTTEDAENATKLFNQIRRDQSVLREITEKYKMRLRHANGRLSVDEAIKADEAMASHFRDVKTEVPA